MSEPVIQLEPGWNLVGFPTMSTGLNVTQGLAGITYSEVICFDDAYPYMMWGLSANDTMAWGKGYWINVGTSQVWNVP